MAHTGFTMKYKKDTYNPLCGNCPEQKKLDQEYDSDSTEVMSSTDEEDRWKDAARTAEIPATYYHIQKLVRYIKSGNQTATIVSLCCLLDYDLTIQINQLAIQDIGGLETLISANIDIRKFIVDLGGVPLITNILDTSNKALKTMAAQTLAHVARVRLARKFVRKCKGIPKLVDLLDIKLE
uniref:Armadillo repeat-containing domain-containing protein n=1 Tax=Megaselia scalaris TaxID=36166 RepID=T1GQL0_MEGSC